MFSQVSWYLILFDNCLLNGRKFKNNQCNFMCLCRGKKCSFSSFFFEQNQLSYHALISEGGKNNKYKNAYLFLEESYSGKNSFKHCLMDMISPLQLWTHSINDTCIKLIHENRKGMEAMSKLVSGSREGMTGYSQMNMTDAFHNFNEQGLKKTRDIDLHSDKIDWNSRFLLKHESSGLQRAAGVHISDI